VTAWLPVYTHAGKVSYLHCFHTYCRLKPSLEDFIISLVFVWLFLLIIYSLDIFIFLDNNILSNILRNDCLTLAWIVRNSTPTYLWAHHLTLHLTFFFVILNLFLCCSFNLYRVRNCYFCNPSWSDPFYGNYNTFLVNVFLRFMPWFFLQTCSFSSNFPHIFASILTVTLISSFTPYPHVSAKSALVRTTRMSMNIIMLISHFISLWFLDTLWHCLYVLYYISPLSWYYISSARLYFYTYCCFLTFSQSFSIS